MGIRQLESAITWEARTVFENSKLRVKDVQEWSSAPIKPKPGEVVEKMPLNGVWVAIREECDKRKR